MPVILYGIAIAGATLSLWWAITAKPSAARANLLAGLDLPEARPKTPVTAGLGRTARRFLPADYLRSLDTTLVQAAHPWRLDLPRLLGVKLISAVMTLLLGLAVSQPLFGVILAFVVFFVPDYLVITQRDSRQAAIQAAVADTIDQLTICVEAGLGFDAALQRVAATTDGPLAAELQRTVEDVRAGIPRDQALRTFANRTRLPEMKRLVSALVQAQRHGVTIADTLRVQSAELRDRRTQAVEEKAAKLSTKMIFPIMVCFLPVFFVVILVPSIAEIANQF